MSGLWEVAAACGACGGDEWTVEREICARRFGRCRGCGVIRLIDRVAEERLDLLYADYYPATLAESDLELQLANPSFAFRRRRLEAAVGNRERRLHEIGCGDGNFLAALQRAGWVVSGAEFGPTAHATAQRHRIDVRPLDAAPLVPPGGFAVVAAYHVLEHVYHPAAWLQAAAALLAPDGLLHIQVPNYASLSRALTGRQWASWHFPQHVFLFTPATLTGLLRRGGFTTLSLTTWDPWHGPGTVSSSLRNAARNVTRGESPWTSDLGGAKRHGPAPAADRAVAMKRVAHQLVTGAAGVLARLEAAAGRGAVIDVVAARNFSSPPAENSPPSPALR